MVQRLGDRGADCTTLKKTVPLDLATDLLGHGRSCAPDRRAHGLVHLLGEAVQRAENPPYLLGIKLQFDHA